MLVMVTVPNRENLSKISCMYDTLRTFCDIENIKLKCMHVSRISYYCVYLMFNPKNLAQSLALH